MWARAALAIGLSCTVVSLVMPELHHHGWRLAGEKAGDHLNTKFGTAFRSIRKNILIFSPSPNIGKSLLIHQRNCMLKIKSKNNCRCLTSRRDNGGTFPAPISQIRKFKIRWQWGRIASPIYPHAQILRWGSPAIFPHYNAAPAIGRAWISDRYWNEIADENIRPIAEYQCGSGIKFREFGRFVCEPTFIERQDGENSLKKCNDKEQPRKSGDWVCPEFLPPPLIAFSAAIIVIACGLYVQWRGWRRTARQRYRGWAIAAIGICVMGFGWFGLFFGDWWSPIICALRVAI